ncbi:MAG: hypothetical protein WAN76_26670 [Candidatus Sulfotelmatobacter sp.]
MPQSECVRVRMKRGMTDDALTIRPAINSEVDWCAELMAANDPWLTYKC